MINQSHCLCLGVPNFFDAVASSFCSLLLSLLQLYFMASVAQACFDSDTFEAFFTPEN
jgi:hypothetical protein